jgi:predicted kinase
LFLTYGVSGSGKSHFARRLAEAIGAVQIRSDVERKRLFLGNAFPEPNKIQRNASEELYTRRATDKTYARLEHLTAAALHAGFSVIADATFLSQARRDRFRQLAETLRAPFLILDFQATPEVLRRRILARQREGRDASDADLQVLQQQLAARQPLAEHELAHALVIDAPAPEAVEDALAAAGRWASADR